MIFFFFFESIIKTNRIFENFWRSFIKYTKISHFLFYYRHLRIAILKDLLTRLKY